MSLVTFEVFVRETALVLLQSADPAKSKYLDEY